MRHIHSSRLRALLFTLFLSGLTILAACGSLFDNPRNILEEGEELSGGQVTVFNTTRNAFGHPAPGLSREDGLNFFVGNSFFNQNWVTAPASTTARDGVGPLFNTRSCAGCHAFDGRGRAPNKPGELGTGFLIRLSVPGAGPNDGPLPEATYGGQFQDQAILDVPDEGQIKITYTEINGAFADGTAYTLRKPDYELVDLQYGPLDPETLISPRVAPQIIGLGLLEAIREEDILARADPNDSDGDGISGRPNTVWDVQSQSQTLGRFGWKANQPNLAQQTAGAFLGDMGITTSLFPDQNCTDAQTACQEARDGGKPEIIDDDFDKVVLYASTLAVPGRRDWDSDIVLRGKRLFAETGCTACHAPLFETGEHPRFPALSNQTIRPYTDLLLHDMGPELTDGRPDFQASGSEWRTPPLWGIGLFETVNGHTTYLHDGRARNLMEAVLWHGGEAEVTKQKVLQLDERERDALIAFLESL
ncbi:MAG: c-type cytochrome [Chloroflexales bacterium]|nr:c-type cytochrome [Chloroflexales bacterium]